MYALSAGMYTTYNGTARDLQDPANVQRGRWITNGMGIIGTPYGVLRILKTA